MDTISTLCSLLETKKELFLEYETATQALLDCPPDDAENYITQRARKASEIDGIEEQINTLCGQQPDAVLLRRYAHAQIEFSQVPSEYQCVFYAAQAVLSVIQRIIQSDAQVLERLEGLRDEAMGAIRQNQNLPKIKKYLTDLTEQPPPGSLQDGKA